MVNKLTILAFAIFSALAVSVTTPTSTRAQGVPGRISFAARLSDGGAPVTGTHDLAFGIADAATGGSVIWSEMHEDASVEDGLIFIELGGATALDDLVFSGDTR